MNKFFTKKTRKIKMNRIKIRQGDVLLIPVESIPQTAERKNDKILAEGEVTGHHHQFEMMAPVQCYMDQQQIYIDVAESTTLFHEEHENLNIPVGKFLVDIQQEISLENDLQRVMD